jgi:hypothetical protein
MNKSAIKGVIDKKVHTDQIQSSEYSQNINALSNSSNNEKSRSKSKSKGRAK